MTKAWFHGDGGWSGKPSFGVGDIIYNVVWFFGGYRASEDDVASWRESAIKQKPELTVEAFAWIPGASATDPLPSFHQGGVLANRILAAPHDHFVIVGHSSGCALANDVAERALALGAKNFRLVCLDGFRPPKTLTDFAQVWSAEWENHLSLNYHSLQSHPNFRVYHPEGCTRLWSLHFSLVNKAATDVVVDGIIHGYRHCQANLDVL